MLIGFQNRIGLSERLPGAMEGLMNKRKPNILLITCDQLRAFATGCYGNPEVRTPNMDALKGITTCPVEKPNQPNSDQHSVVG